MPNFLLSQVKILGRNGGSRPWKWTTEPVYGNGPMQPPTVVGVKQTPTGVFILLSDELIERAKDTLTAAEKTEIASWIYRVSSENPLPANHVDAALWHIPMWSGETRAVLLRVPAAIWNDPKTVPPLKLRQFLKQLWQ